MFYTLRRKRQTPCNKVSQIHEPGCHTEENDEPENEIQWKWSAQNDSNFHTYNRSQILINMIIFITRTSYYLLIRQIYNTTNAINFVSPFYDSKFKYNWIFNHIILSSNSLSFYVSDNIQ
jgi:hypothetical protein